MRFVALQGFRLVDDPARELGGRPEVGDPQLGIQLHLKSAISGGRCRLGSNEVERRRGLAGSVARDTPVRAEVALPHTGNHHGPGELAEPRVGRERLQ